MRNVLIPTDFSVESVDRIGLVARAIDDKLNVILFHAFDMPGSLVDAIVRNSNNGDYNLVTEHLRVRCRRIKVTHRNVANISFKFMYGTTSYVFNSFAAANKIDTIVLPENYHFTYVVRESVNPVRMFKKSGIEIMSGFSGLNEKHLAN